LLLIAPLLVIFSSAVLCVVFWSYPRVQKMLALAGATAYLITDIVLFRAVAQTGPIALQIGGWAAPYGITLVVDLFSAAMMLITAIIGLTTLLYSLQNVDKKLKRKGFFPIFLFLLLGVNGSFMAGDVFNLYVWYEVMLLASFVLISMGNTKAQLEGAVKYVILNFIASGFFLTGIGVLYKVTGSINMADLAVLIREQETGGLITLASLFFLVCFGIKSAIFPLFSWLPASYHTPPVAVSALMAGLLTKVGVYSLIRFYTLIFVQDVAFTHTLLLVIAGSTMVVGVFGAMSQQEFRKILSFHIISQIGYMVMGLALYTPLAIAGGVFYIIHHIIVKTNLFLISGLVRVTHGSYQLKELGGVYNRFPAVAGFFVIAAFSLAGIPPLSGFWGKFALAKAGLEIDQVALVATSLFVGFLTLYSMIKIWNSVFWGKETEDDPPSEQTEKMSQKQLFTSHAFMVIPVLLLAGMTVYIGLMPNALLELSQEIAQQLLSPDAYIKAVLGDR